MPIETRTTKKGTSYRAVVWSAGRGSKKLSRTFPTKAAAQSWERNMQTAKERGLILADPSAATVEQASAEMIAGMKAGTVLNRSGKPYKLIVAQGYEDAFRLHVNPLIGHLRLVDVKRKDLQALVSKLIVGKAASTVRNIVVPLQVLFKLALRDELISVNPAVGIELPKGTGKRERIASPAEASKLIEALKPEDRALWAVAFYAGLRRGEIQALRWSDIDFEAGIINVTRGYDQRNREFSEAKSEAGKRRVPLLAVLREHLAAHRSLSDGQGLVFGATSDRPFRDTAVRKRSLTAWKGMTPISLHECRHTFASMLIASGMNLKSIQTYLGHADIATTMDVYGHLMPGSEVTDAARLDTWLASQ